MATAQCAAEPGNIGIGGGAKNVEDKVVGFGPELDRVCQPSLRGTRLGGTSVQLEAPVQIVLRRFW